MTRKPDFFLVGGPRCGTTSLCQYLDAHPEIHIPEQKEFHLFAPDLKWRIPRYELDRYLDHFEGRPEPVLGEGSTWHLLSVESARLIHEFRPDARIIICLRQPAEMIHSVFALNVMDGDEDLDDLVEALDAEEDRRAGRRPLPKYARHQGRVFYRDIVSFASQVERYLDVFGREQVKVILLDDLKADVEKVYVETLEHVGAEDLSFRPDFAVHNVNRVPRSKLLLRLMNMANRPWIRSVMQSLPVFLKPNVLKEKLVALNRKETKRIPLDPELKARLTEELRPDIERLGALIERDLSIWYR